MSQNPFARIENIGEDGGLRINEFVWDDQPRINVGTIENFQEPKIAAKHLAYMGKCCLDFIRSNRVFQEKYRIVLSPKGGNWNLYLHLDPVAWFDALIWIKNEARGIAVKKARAYVNNVRETYHPSHIVESKYYPVLSKSYCNHHGDCIQREYLPY